MREETFTVRTRSREQIVLITREVNAALGNLTTADGIATIIVPHTTPSATAKATRTRTFYRC